MIGQLAVSDGQRIPYKVNWQAWLVGHLSPENLLYMKIYVCFINIQTNIICMPNFT